MQEESQTTTQCKKVLAQPRGVLKPKYSIKEVLHFIAKKLHYTPQHMQSLHGMTTGESSLGMNLGEDFKGQQLGPSVSYVPSSSTFLCSCPYFYSVVLKHQKLFLKEYY